MCSGTDVKNLVLNNTKATRSHLLIPTNTLQCTNSTSNITDSEGVVEHELSTTLGEFGQS